MSTVLITGGTGLVGSALSNALLNKGFEVIILTRSMEAVKKLPIREKLRYATWDIKNKFIGEEAVSSADYIIHLAGAGVADKRWTANRKKEILDSRVESSKLIVDSLKSWPHKVKAVVSSSAIGWYGPDITRQDQHSFVETDPPANDFLGKTCQQWEESIEPVTASVNRLVILRTGIVLSTKGGALKEFLKPLRFRVAAILGNGKQMISWIHIDDLVNMYINAIANDQMKGVYNAVAPVPVSNRDLMLAVAAHKKEFVIPFYVPSFLLKWILGEMSVEVLKSTRVSAEKIQQTGFRFQFPFLHEALADLVTAE